MAKAAGGAIRTLSLRSIASWQVREALNDGERPAIVASLPALQRGAVWRSAQVETLWDSVAWGFPIGSFLLMPFDATLGMQKMLLGRQPLPATHMLLDGQQRANAIALGFLAPWQQRQLDAPAALWVDLGAPASPDRMLHARLVSRAHPWGYPATSDRQRLEMADIRRALVAFRAAECDVAWQRKPPVCCSWPWDAWAPVPLPVLLAAINGSRAAVMNALSRMVPWWESIVTKHGGLAVTLPKSLDQSRELIGTLQDVARRYRVPALNIDLRMRNGQEEGLTGSKDPAETLFLRINAGGTPLQGEELIYSMVKAIWPDAAQLVGAIQHHLVSEPRAALLIARLALVVNTSSALPPAPEVARFRRLVHGDLQDESYRKRLEGYLRKRAIPLFRDARELLTGGEFALPPVLAADLGRGEVGREILFLLLRWIERLHELKMSVSNLKPTQRRRTLGALTAISWFARKPEGCVSVLWPLLQQCKPDELPDFFERKNLRFCLERDSRRREPPMILLPSPMTLARQVAAKITAPRGSTAAGGFRDPGSSFWREWDWYETFGTMSFKLERWYRRAMTHLRSIDTAEESWKERAAADWVFFADKVWGERRLVLHAQRLQLSGWFPDFDPTHPESVEEMNRPWDMDHIHPRYYIEGRHNIPRVVRVWHGSIGNLRAWPFDANRADAEAQPADKLDGEVDDVLLSYGIRTAADKRSASFVSEAQWKDWRGCTPAAQFPPRYLSMTNDYGHCRIALVRALTSRTVALYKAWYDDLRVKALMPMTEE